MKKDGWLSVFVLTYIFVGVILPSFLNKFIVPMISMDWASFLGSYIGGIFGGLATLIAVLVSLNKGRQIQEEAEIRENSLIVYYDLKLGLLDLKRLYTNVKNSNFQEVPNGIFLSEDWIRNVALIAARLSDVDIVYKLYGDLEMLKNELKKLNDFDSVNMADDYNKSKFNSLIQNLAFKVFSESFLNEDFSVYSKKKFNLELNLNDLNEAYKKMMVEIAGDKESIKHGGACHQLVNLLNIMTIRHY